MALEGILSSDKPGVAATLDDVQIPLIHAQDTVLVGTIAETRTLMQVNPRFFILKCYPDLPKAVPDFHCELLQAMRNTDIENLVCVQPRGTAKTMIARCCAVNALCTGQSPFTVVVNKVVKDAVNSTREVWRILRDPFFQQVYGTIEPVIERDGIGEYEFIQNGQYKVLYARGRDSAIQGLNVANMRPNFFLFDDIEQAKDGDKEASFEDTKSWFFETMLFAMDEDNKRVVYIGNMNKANSLICTLPTLEDWHSIILSIIKDDGTSLWEEKFPLDRVLAEFRQYCSIGLRRQWLAQKMSRVEDDEKSMLGMDEVTFHHGLYPEEIEYGCITIDPAISDSVKADESVIIAHGWHDGAWNRCAKIHGRGFDPIQLIVKAINLALHWHLTLICVETVAYQKALLPLFDMELRKRGLEHTIRVRGINSRNSKDVRMSAIVAMIRNGSYRLARDDHDIVGQINDWQIGRKNTHDDLLDCCAMLPLAMQSFRHMMAKSIAGPAYTAMQSGVTSISGYDMELAQSSQTSRAFNDEFIPSTIGRSLTVVDTPH